MISALSTLAELAKNDEWGVIGEVLSPEIHQLVLDWDTLSSEKKGELAGYALGKHGLDIVLPGAVAKVAAKSIKSAKKLAGACRNLKIAKETLILETAAEVGNTGKLAEIVAHGRKTTFLADELGFTAKEMGKLKQVGKLEMTVTEAYEHLSLPMKESFQLFEKAQKFLKPHKGFMPEIQIRELIHQTGIPTFPRPKGIPKNFRVKLSNRGAGMKYVHPKHPHTSVRVMPGKPHSPFEYQQKPYVIQMKDGKVVDKYGNVVGIELPEAHIPIKEFIYSGE
ncbi:hypothetical protein [Candidatus Neptunochlamydia vexilliferae]|uniref:Pre-toxin TG domain-containing protein n=1 Tax=Candidatus Neptunichlamydia vexilliferae TaxID=1651774 RepID=A0ABS0B1W1_9BACT|nr:hypothetical protein [Candidatus Neptunochlamydia vexilliferae]MBF5060195.1 hypothetical protein [Candidatus Neptunochlamydia vexilliferae]